MPDRSAFWIKNTSVCKGQMEKLEESREEWISYMWEEYEITPNNALAV